MQLKSVVPFGRSLAEYRQMFALTPADLVGQILGVGDGPASFNAEATPLGASIISVDPIYKGLNTARRSGGFPMNSRREATKCS